ncbi:unnamed protein product [Adineta steineri]|uniref:Uncharacterized protein n=2 Tax=Adineta steineri TaxID=433720 RepID=A0A818MIJ8_9BILA|nr:unnamed protein product [Adineta steineri]
MYHLSRASRMVRIPNDPIAKLMYYLDIVCTLVEYKDHSLDRLRNYSNYKNLSDNEVRVLYITCAALDPDELIGKVIFEDEDGDL